MKENQKLVEILKNEKEKVEREKERIKQKCKRLKNSVLEHEKENKKIEELFKNAKKDLRSFARSVSPGDSNLISGTINQLIKD